MPTLCKQPSDDVSVGADSGFANSRDSTPPPASIFLRLTPVLAAFAALVLIAPALRAQAAASPLARVTDAAGVHDALANAETTHRSAYQAAKYDDALRAARDGFALAEKFGTLADQIQFLRHLAYDNWLVGDNESAIDYSQRLLDAADLQNSDLVRAQAHRYLSQVYETLNDDARSRTHAEQSLHFAVLAEDPLVRIQALNAVGLSQARAGNYEAATHAFEEGRAYYEKQGNRLAASNSLANLADLADVRGDLPRALQLYEEILATRTAIKDARGQVRAVSAIASLLRRLGRSAEALARLTAIRAQAEAIGGHRLLTEFYTDLAQVQETLGDFAAALRTERLAATEREQLVSERARLRASELETRLELAQKEQAIEHLRSVVATHDALMRSTAADLAQVRSFQIAVVDGIVVVAVIAVAGLLVWRYRVRSRRLHTAVKKALESYPPFEKPPSEPPSPSCAQ